jgi:aspartyl-tRNA synthetase
MSYRTHHCNALRLEHAGSSATLCGWVASRRDHGGLIFIDLRDRFGLTQLVFDKEDATEGLLAQADKLRNEDCIAAEGTVRVRDGGPNPKLETGQIEIVVSTLTMLGKAETPPFLPDDKAKLPGEETRLRYRYLDLRRPAMQKIIQTRHRVAQLTRRYFDEQGFLEIETPMLTKSTPEEIGRAHV